MAVYEVVLEGRQDGEDMLNVFHYRVPDGQTPDWQAGADELRAHIANYLADLSNPNVTYEGITVRLDEPGQVGTTYAFTLGDVVGLDASGDGLRQAAFLIQKRSQGGVRPTLGWFFVGGITVHGLTAAGNWDPAITAVMNNYAEDIRILGAVAQTDVIMVIKARNPTAPNTQAYSDVDLMFAKGGTPRTVRSRMIGNGS